MSAADGRLCDTMIADAAIADADLEAALLRVKGLGPWYRFSTHAT